MADRVSGKVPLPEVGEGHYLQFTWAAQVAIEAELGEFVYLDKLSFGIPRLSAKCLDLMFSHCVHVDGKHVRKSGADWPEGEPLQGFAEKALDAIALAHRGKTHEEWVKDVQASAKAGAENPTSGTAA